MLRTLSKNNTFEVDLSGAIFICRPLSGREFRRLESLQDATAAEKSTSTLFDALRRSVRGWRNVLVEDEEMIEALRAAGAELSQAGPTTFEIAYAPELLDMILDIEDAGDLIGRISKGNRPNGAEVGKSDSPAPSAPA